MTAHLASWSQVHGRRRADKSACQWPAAAILLPVGNIPANERQAHDASDGPSCSVWEVPPLSADERAELARLFDEKSVAYLASVEARVVALGAIAERLGRKVGLHEMTKADSLARLDRATYALNLEMPVAVGAVPKHRARAIASASFARGFERGAR